MNVETVPLTSLTPDPLNARKHNRRNIDAIKASLSKFGQRKPIVVTNDGIVIAGNGTLEAATSLGWKEISIARAPEEWDEKTVRAYALADNQTGALAEWDDDVLNTALEDLTSEGWDIAELGFDLNIDVTEPLNGDLDDVPEAPVTPKTQLGDIYQLGRHRLMCGDSTDPVIIGILMNGQKADMVLTDPPYGMFLDTDWSDIKGSLKSAGAKSNTSGKKYDKVIGDHEDFTPELITTIFNNFALTKEMFIFGADYFAELLPDKNDGSWLVWDKRKPSQENAIGAEFELIWSKFKHKRRVLRHDWFGFLSSNNALEARNRVHPTQKPSSLIIDILTQWSKDEQNIVDLYGGSGTTLIACEKTNRICYMMELDPKYVDVIITRWESATGNKAVLL